jgi:hypothetical protein
MNSLLLTEFFNPQRTVIAKRLSVALINWAQEILTADIPGDISDDWIRRRLLAARIMPQAGPEQQYVLLTRSYFLADSETQLNIRQICSDMNTEEEELELSELMATILRRFVSQLAETQISPDQVAGFYLEHELDPPSNSGVYERVIKLREMKQAGAQTYTGV